MNNKLILLALLSGAALLGCMQPKVDIDAEQAALRAAADAYHQAGSASDVDGVVGLYANDGVMLPPNGQREAGLERIRAHANAFTDLPGFNMRFENLEVAVAASGDMGYTLADTVIAFDGPDGEPVEDQGRDFHLWKKQDGEWKIAIDIWNSKLPLPAAEDAETPPPDMLSDALSAAWPGMKAAATVVDWEGNVLKEGSNGYTCMPTPPMLTGTAPMCLDSEWLKWADAWQNRTDYAPESLGISYMLAGDEGASNIDPYAEGPTEDNEWIREGAHLMIVAPAELLGDYPTDPQNGGPYVMWEGTPYAHLMVPIGSRE